jgi:hypothetical protein
VTKKAKEIPSISKEIEYVVKEGLPVKRFSEVYKGIASIQIGKIMIPKCLEIHL